MFGNEKVVKKGSKRVHETVVAETSKRHRKSKPVIVLCMEEDEEDYPVSLEVETKSAEGGSGFLKHVQVNLLSHCIFCLRKTTNGPVDQQTDSEYVQVVPRTAICSSPSSGQYLPIFNRTWRYLHMKNESGKRQEDPLNLMESIPMGGTEENTKTRFLNLPRICQFCFGGLETVDRLFKQLDAQLDVMGTIIKDSKCGKYPWRARQFENSLKSSNFDGDVVDATINLLDNLGGSSQVAFGITKQIHDIQEDEFNEGAYYDDPLASPDLIPNSPSSTPAGQNDSILVSEEAVQQENVQFPKFSRETKNDYITCQDKEEESAEDFFAQDDYDDNVQEDPDYIKSEPEDDFSEDESSTSCPDDNFQKGRPVPKRKDPEGVDSSSTSLDDENNTFKRRSFANGSNKATLKKYEKSTLWDKMVANKTFSKAFNHRVFREEYTCQVDACGEACAAWSDLIDHQVKAHNLLDGANQHQCKECDRLFGTAEGLVNHMRKGHRTQLCDVCSTEVPSKDILEHVRAHVGEEYLFKCPNPKCPCVYTRLRSLREHLRERNKRNVKITNHCLKSLSNVNEFFDAFNICQECGYKAEQRRKLRTHVVREHENATKNFVCPIEGCTQMFSTRHSVSFHLSSHDMPKTLDQQSCSDCNKMINVSEMAEHLKEAHQPKEIIRCCRCPFLFSSREFMLDHVNVHKGGTFSCDMCTDQIKYSHHGKLREHYFLKHQLGSRRICDQCTFVGLSEQQLEDHCKRYHGGDDASGDVPKKYVPGAHKCDICFAIFLKSFTLQDHKIKEHGSTVLHSCKSCDKTFITYALLLKHETVHGGGPPKEELFGCDVDGCGKAFTTNRGLKRHILAAHHREKRKAPIPHICDTCGKAFSNGQGLKNHNDTVHLKITKCICETCGESFASGTTLKNHQLIHSGQRPFACEICDQRFRYKEVLKRHVEGHSRKGAHFKPNGPMKQLRKRVERK